jgi:histone H3/H4
MEAAALERSVARVAVAQTLQSLGFTSAKGSALEALVGVLLRFLSEAGHLTHESAQHAGRATPCLPDVLRALQLLGVDVSRLVTYVSACYQGTATEVPFAQPLPRYPARKRPKRVNVSFQELGRQPQSQSVNKWLPALPEAHTYQGTAVHRPAPPDDSRVRRELNSQTVGAEAKLAKLAEALEPTEATDYTTATRWGGGARLDGDAELVQKAREAEQQAALAWTSPEAAAGNPFVQSAVGLYPPTALALPSSGRGAAHGGQASAASVLAKLPAGPEGGAGRGLEEAPTGVSWVALDTAASQAIRCVGVVVDARVFECSLTSSLSLPFHRRGLLPVDSFSLASGSRTRATARNVGATRLGGLGGSFAALPGRDGGGGYDDEDDANARKASDDADRVARMMARDPHGPLLDNWKDLINQ